MKEEQNMVKDAMVIGGGIAGIQASLDLADKGIQVYLVEKEPSIGGRMAQLDKTFPTNDCSICILAPKMADCYRHENIHLLTCAEVEKVSGEAGNFDVKVRKKTRYVHEDKCTGCNDCTEVCPVELPDEFNMGLGNRKAIYRMFTQAVPNVFRIDKRGDPPCRATCPASINGQGYVALISKGKFKEALALVREKAPFPGVLGRICHHPCETECNRREVDEPISICELKRFLADYEIKKGEPEVPELPEKKDEKIAIVGAGPAGLTAANNLVRLGYQITIFEALPVTGGMLKVGIPDYRLPPEVLDREIQAILDLGVEIQPNTRIGKDITIQGLFDKGYNAIFLATGAHKSMKLKVEGEDLEGVYHGVDFLRDVALGNDPKIGKKVAVIGGGNVAIDSVRTARRMGAEAFIIYRRSREEMPAYPWEIEEAEEEGIEINFLATPIKIIGKDGKVSAIECIKMELGEPDESGRRRPVPIEGSEFTMEVDTIIPAIGQRPGTEYASDDIEFNVTKWNTLVVNPNTMMTSIQGVFAGGDNVAGPASAVEAVAHGNKAADAIDRYIRGVQMVDESQPTDQIIVTYDDMELTPAQKVKKPRENPNKLNAADRANNFDEVIPSTLTEEEAIREAERCLNCAGCSDCHECFKACKPGAIDYYLTDEFVDLNVGAIVVATGFDVWSPKDAPEYGYPKYPNVYTAMEFERLINAAGPTGGHIHRRSDGQRPKKIGFIQCVGSRNVQQGHPYCCSVCCMHSTKEAMLAHEHHDDIESTIFYKDLRSFGKGFFEYTERAKKDYDVTYINSDGTVKENPENNNPIIVYDIGGRPHEKEFDMVVLATTLIPRAEAQKLAKILGIGINEFGFYESADKLFSAVNTNKSGVYLAGYCHEPMDIPEAVAQASGAAERAAETIFKEVKA
jgi:heterodisulfide reductase subunit A-like polyferredoxin